VQNWHQPIIQPVQDGISAFMVRKVAGEFQFLVQAKLECGNLDILELAPTVQCLTGGFQNANSLEVIPFLTDILNADEDSRIIDVLQSEEGGRFYHESNRNMIVEVNDQFNHALPENYMWISLKQLLFLLKFNNFLNIQARSLISLINYL